MDSNYTSVIESLWERYREGDFKVVDEAEKYLKENDLPEDFKSLYYVSLSLFCLMANKIQESKDYASKARELFSPEGQYLDEAGLIFAEASSYLFDGKISICKEKLNKDITSHQLKLLLADCFLWSGEFEKSIELYLEAYKICEKNQNLEEDILTIKLNKAKALFYLNKLNEAEELLNSIFKRKKVLNDGSLEEIKILIAAELVKIKAFQGKIPSARMFFHTDLKFDNFKHPYKRYSILKARGILRFKANKIEAAEEDFFEALALPVRKFEKLEIWLYLGNLSLEKKDYKSAESYYKKILDFPEIFFAKIANDKLQEISLEITKVDSKDVEKKVASKAEILKKAERKKIELQDVESEEILEETVKTQELTEIEELNKIQELQLENQLSTMEELPITALLMGMEFLENY